MKNFKRIAILVIMFSLTLTLSGCVREYNTPEFVTIEPSQTAFLVPLVGDSNDQAKFDSEEALDELKVAVKEIQIPKRWVKTGRMYFTGEWRPSARVIVVERKPETREWTADSSTGTDVNNQGIEAESNESIAFTVSMNVSAQIEEADAAKFLYRYNNKPLSEIMDDELRARIESIFVEECGARTMLQILSDKQVIMNIVREDVTAYFLERGITITVIGLKGEVKYNDPTIQDEINAPFKAAKQKELAVEQALIAAINAERDANLALIEAQKMIDLAQKDVEAQTLVNQMLLEQAQNEAAIIVAMADADREALRQSVLAFSSTVDPITGDYVVTEQAVYAYVQLAYYEAWDGSVPQTILDAVLSTLAVDQPIVPSGQ